jgi:hypothetical protein
MIAFLVSLGTSALIMTLYILCASLVWHCCYNPEDPLINKIMLVIACMLGPAILTFGLIEWAIWKWVSLTWELGEWLVAFYL